MAYTRPAASAADATWVGASAYTRPGAGVADAYFVTGITATGFLSTTFGTALTHMAQPVSGFLSTTFGTPELNLNSTCMATSLSPGAAFGAPRAAFAQVTAASGFLAPTLGAPSARCIQPATGFTPLLFGTGLGYKTQRPTGFTTTQFGEPRLFPCHAVGFKPTTFGQARLFPFHVGPGFGPALFGTPAGTQHWDMEAWPPVTRFGIPTTPTDRTAQATGSVSTHFGQPLAVKYAPPNTGQRGQSFGAHSTLFGTPRAGWLQTGQAVGFTTTGFGIPNGVAVQGSAGFSSTVLGTPLARLAQQADGFKPTLFGAPSATRIQQATGLYRATRFGLPTTLRSNWYPTYGFPTAKFGHPTGFSRINYPAAGFAGGFFGTPTCHQRHRVLAMPPCVRLGTPLLKRTTQC